MIISYSQNGEDILLYRCFKELKTGFYIDVGANHPEDGSVTKLFYDLGWRGINIEPDPFSFELLCDARLLDINVNYCVSESEEDLEFYQIKETGLSSLYEKNAQLAIEKGFLSKKILVKGKRLTTILDEFKLQDKEIHFLKIDTEGGEEQVIKSLDFSIYKPWIVLFESVTPYLHEDISNTVDNLLVKNNYIKVFFDGLNSYFVRNDKYDEFKGYFNVPVNFLDEFIRIRELNLYNEVQRYKLKLKELETNNILDKIKTTGIYDLYDLINTYNKDINNLSNKILILEDRNRQFQELKSRVDYFLTKFPVKFSVNIYIFLSKLKQKIKLILKRFLRYSFNIISNIKLLRNLLLRDK